MQKLKRSKERLRLFDLIAIDLNRYSFDVNQPSTNLQQLIYLISFNKIIINARLIELLFLEFTYLNVKKISVYSFRYLLHYMNSNYIKLFVFRHVQINGILLYKNFIKERKNCKLNTNKSNKIKDIQLTRDNYTVAALMVSFTQAFALVLCTFRHELLSTYWLFIATRERIKE